MCTRDLDVPPDGVTVEMRLVPERTVPPAQPSGMDDWIGLVGHAQEAGLVIDADLRVRSTSAAVIAILRPAVDPLGKPLIPARFRSAPSA